MDAKPNPLELRRGQDDLNLLLFVVLINRKLQGRGGRHIQPGEKQQIYTEAELKYSALHVNPLGSSQAGMLVHICMTDGIR